MVIVNDNGKMCKEQSNTHCAEDLLKVEKTLPNLIPPKIIPIG